MEEILKRLRAEGWRVAVHNDYQVGDDRFTFWLMTHRSGVYLKGEASTDIAALEKIDAQSRTRSVGIAIGAIHE